MTFHSDARAVLAERLDRAINKLTKWRSVLTGWQLGTRDKDDPEAQSVRDHRELSLLMRAELSAITRLLLEKKVCTLDEFQQALLEEVEFLDKAHEKKFPGMRSDDNGIVMTLPQARETMKGWLP